MGTASSVCGRDALAIRDVNLASKKQAPLWKCEITQWPRPMGWQDGEESWPDQVGVSRARFLTPPRTGRSRGPPRAGQSRASLGMAAWKVSSAACLQAAEKRGRRDGAAIPHVRDRHKFNDCNTDLPASRSDRDRFRRRYTIFRSLFSPAPHHMVHGPALPALPGNPGLLLPMGAWVEAKTGKLRCL
jgi:hypothetical protein